MFNELQKLRHMLDDAEIAHNVGISDKAMRLNVWVSNGIKVSIIQLKESMTLECAVVTNEYWNEDSKRNARIAEQALSLIKYELGK